MLMAISKEYIAGFFDGEGNISISPHRVSEEHKGPYLVLIINITQVDRTPLEHIAALYGGNIRIHRPANTNWSVVHRWNITARSALKFLEDIVPYLIVKREEALIAIEFQKLKKLGSRYARNPEVRELEWNYRNDLFQIREDRKLVYKKE